MNNNINLIKGIHPGLILGRELKKRGLSNLEFAQSINEFPQTIGAIINGKRRMNPGLSLKIANVLNVEDGYFMALQAYFDVKQERLKSLSTPDLSKIRKAIFWDTDITKIDWELYKASVIRRVYERGNGQEKEEICRFYGKDQVDSILLKMNRL